MADPPSEAPLIHTPYLPTSAPLPFQSNGSTTTKHRKSMIRESNMEMEEGTGLEVFTHRMENHPLTLSLEQGIEATHLVAMVWWIEQIRMRIEPNWSHRTESPTHSVQMASLRSRDQDHRCIRCIILGLDTDPLPKYPIMNSLNILVWNCYRAGNSAFKRNMRELISNHKPEILLLMETKVPFSSMGNFFNTMGFIAATIADLVGRACGIWLLWDTAHVSIRASIVTNQVIQATIHKEEILMTTLTTLKEEAFLLTTTTTGPRNLLSESTTATSLILVVLVPDSPRQITDMD
ncbi:hypothetical protein LOK49_LG06G01909 [Camellia lanceoleosa]|uniref:Uncharacterized protein n=1 Tax=Camellia lanceoleosa TaxID=1840588 RepID=A0ACC0HFZ0_9ERIC|nr:hypothetical protein LOK49_LG06G01909 [Camellia lanceoleosa]